MIAVAKARGSSGFGTRLRQLRKAAGLTLEQLGERAEMAYQAIARLERQEREPTWPTAVKLAEALGVSTDAFRDSPVDHQDEQPADEPEPPKRRGKR